MSNAVAQNIEMADELWRAHPHTYAERLSKDSDELWVAYDYLKVVSRKIAQKVAEGGGKLIVEMPPRHGKSTLISFWTPIWFLDLFPTKKVMLATYQADFAASWGRKVRNEIQSNPGVTVEIAQDSSASSRWETKEGGGMFTAGIGGPFTGKGGHLIIIDDPVKNWQEAASEKIRKRNIDWMKSTAQTRAEPGCVFVVLQTRWHEGDLAGHLQSNEEGWEVIRFPALAEKNDPLGREEGEALCPARYNRESLLEKMIELGSKFWAALFQQRPSPEEGDIFKRNWWQFYTELPEGVSQWIQSWDMAFKDTDTSDYVVGIVMCKKGSNVYVVDVCRDRLSFTKSVKAVKTLTTKWPQTSSGAKLIEDKANGTGIIDVLKDHLTGIIAVSPKVGKVERANAIQPTVEAGNIFLPSPSVASWVDAFIEECSVFPNGANDDQVDAFTQGVWRLRNKAKTIVSPASIFKTSIWS